MQVQDRGRPVCRFLLGCSLAASLVIGCAEEAPASSALSLEAAEAPASVDARDDAMKLLARVDVGGGSVSYYEPEPGTVLEVQRGEAGDPALSVGSSLSFSGRYARLTGREAPDALVEAEQRANAGGRSSVASLAEQVITLDPPPAPPPVVSLQGTKAEEAWFRATYCLQTDRFWGGLRKTNDSFFESGGLAYMKGGVYVYRGEVLYRFTYTGFASDISPNEGSVFGVAEGQFVGFRASSTLDRSGSSRVFQAAGDGYHHCVNYHF